MLNEDYAFNIGMFIIWMIGLISISVITYSNNGEGVAIIMMVYVVGTASAIMLTDTGG